MKIQLVDPSAFTPPYDRALAAALARAGAEVELLTTRFLYGPVPPAEGYRVEERFYRRSAARGLEAKARVPFKAAEHLADMWRFHRDGEPAIARRLRSDRPDARHLHALRPSQPEREKIFDCG